jgi:RNA polymerase sigma factor (sigma-70 family)
MDRLAQHLPFSVDDFAAVNEHFAAFLETSDAAAGQVLDIWTYCFVRRYFVGKCLHDSSSTASDLESMIDLAFIKVRKSRDTVTSGRYAHWVSVVCRNTFLNYIRSRRPLVSLDDPAAPTVIDRSDVTSRIPFSNDRAQTSLPEQTALALITGVSMVAEPGTDLDWDTVQTREAVAAAIRRLPRYLQEIASLKLMDGLTYQQMSERLNRPVPILRSYGHRMILKLRKDPALNKFFFEDG